MLFEREAALGFHGVLGCSQGIGGRLPHSVLWPTERGLLVVKLCERNKEVCLCQGGTEGHLSRKLDKTQGLSSPAFPSCENMG